MSSKNKSEALKQYLASAKSSAPAWQIQMWKASEVKAVSK